MKISQKETDITKVQELYKSKNNLNLGVVEVKSRILKCFNDIKDTQKENSNSKKQEILK